MTKLFKKKETSDLRTVRYPILLTEAEAAEIRHSAKIRQLSVADFMRRAALGRKADVDYETEIVLALIDSTRAIRALHKAMVERGFPPPEDLLLPIIVGAGDAISRISK
jgi:hypothetical protein